MWTAFETSSKFLWPPMKRSRVKVNCVKAPLDMLSMSGWSSTLRKPFRPVRENQITCHWFREIGWVLLKQSTNQRCYCLTYRVAQRIAPFLYALNSSNINRFSKFFHCQNQEKICNNAITKDPTKPQVCRYTTLCPIKAPRRGVRSSFN